MEDASWLTTIELQKYGVNTKRLGDDSFLPRESDVGASGLSHEFDGLFTCCG